MRMVGLKLFASLCLLGLVAPAAHSQGLIERPPNPTCVAPERPQLDATAALEVAFPDLVPFNLPEDHNNGPIEMGQLPGDGSRWFVAERAGRIHSFPDDPTASELTTVLDIAFHFVGIDYFQQWGITSFAFHPDFENNGQLYVVYNNNDGTGTPTRAVLSRFTSFDAGSSFDATTEEVLLTIEVTINPLHRFGDLAFGPDGFLYFGVGAPAGPDGRILAQDVDDLNGSMLRIDVDGALPYAIPPDNPFAAGGGRPEIYAWGIRNPWRFSFDSVTGDLWLGDVGWASWEEIDIVELGGNYGFPILEGNHCVDVTDCDPLGLAPPVLDYSHDEGAAVIGGFVYRGSLIPELNGTYLFGDSAFTGFIWGLDYDELGQPVKKVVVDFGGRVTGFAEANDGELLVFDVRDKVIYELVPEQAEPPASGGFPTTLSASGCFDPDDPSEPLPGLIPYDVNTELWSDGADKRRWMALPDATSIAIGPDGDFVFPVGTVLAKEFAVDGVPVETRLFMRHPDGGWGGYSFEWADDLSDAVLLPFAKTKTTNDGSAWTYPSRQQCMECHTAGAGFSLGLETAQLNGTFQYPQTGRTANQLTTLDRIGMFTQGLPLTPPEILTLVPTWDETRPLTSRARSYLHVNCSGCHRPGELGQTDLNFRLDASVAALQACGVEPAHGDIGVPGALLLAPGDPAGSVISLRMHAMDVNRMPPVGTAIVDTLGTEVVDGWIAEPDVCVTYPDGDSDGTTDNVDNCLTDSNTAQRNTDGDLYGNRCDPDFDNDGQVTLADYEYLRSVWQTTDALGDLDGSGLVSEGDRTILFELFGGPPGPSGLEP